MSQPFCAASAGDRHTDYHQRSVEAAPRLPENELSRQLQLLAMNRDEGRFEGRIIGATVAGEGERPKRGATLQEMRENST